MLGHGLCSCVVGMPCHTTVYLTGQCLVQLALYVLGHVCLLPECGMQVADMLAYILVLLCGCNIHVYIVYSN